MSRNAPWALWLVSTLVLASVVTSAPGVEPQTTASLGIEVQNGSGEPLSSAQVEFVRDRGGGGTPWSLLVPSGPDGRVLMTGLDPGRYRIVVRADGYREREVSIVLDPQRAEQKLIVVLRAGGIIEGNVVAPQGEPIPAAQVCLEHDTQVEGTSWKELFQNGRICRQSGPRGVVRFPVLPYGRYRVQVEAAEWASLHDDLELSTPRINRRWPLKAGGATAGWVVDEDHRGIQGARVVLTDLLRGGTREGVTDDEGRFFVKGLSPGGWRLRIEAPDSMVRVFDGFVVREGQVTELAELSVRSGLVLEGKVVSADGTGLAESRLRVHERSGNKRVLRMANSDNEGKFRLPGLPPEAVDLLVVPRKGYVPRWIEELQPPRHDLTVEVEKAGRVRGTVKVPKGELPAPIEVSGSTTDPDRSGIAVVPAPSTNEVDPETGEFLLEGVIPGEKVQLWAEAKGYSSATLTVAVDPGREAGPVELVLQRGEAARGRVVDRAGTPIPQARVASERGASALTDLLGEFLLEGLRPGIQSITASHADFASESREVPVPPAEGERLVFELGPGGVITGRVTDADRMPVEGVTLSLGQPARQAFTDPHGRYLFDHVAPGARTIVLRRSDGIEKRTVELAEGQVLDVDFGLGTVLEGRMERAGAPVAHTAVSLTIPMDWRSDVATDYTGCSTATDAEGRYRLAGVRAGWGTFLVQFENQEVHRVVEVPAGRSPRLDLSLPPSELRGRVITGADERPLAGAQVRLDMERPDGAPSSPSYWVTEITGPLGQRVRYSTAPGYLVTTRTEDAGAFRVLAPESGHVQLTAWVPGYESQGVGLDMPETGPIEIRLERKAEGTETGLAAERRLR